MKIIMLIQKEIMNKAYSKEDSVLAPIEEWEGEYYSDFNNDSEDVNMIEDDLNKDDEYNKIDKDTKVDHTEEVNGAETTVNNDRQQIYNTGTVMNRLNMSFDWKSYGKSVHRQFLTEEEKHDTHDITSYMTVDTEFMFTKMSAQAGITKIGEQAVVLDLLVLCCSIFTAF